MTILWLTLGCIAGILLGTVNGFMLSEWLYRRRAERALPVTTRELAAIRRARSAAGLQNAAYTEPPVYKKVAAAYERGLASGLRSPNPYSPSGWGPAPQWEEPPPLTPEEFVGPR